jgi:hypothetical protein
MAKITVEYKGQRVHLEGNAESCALAMEAFSIASSLREYVDKETNRYIQDVDKALGVDITKGDFS